MTKAKQLMNPTAWVARRATGTALALGIVLVLVVVASQPAQAQYTYKPLHNFTGGQDGATPKAGVKMDTPGNLYGTTSSGSMGYGTVYQLKHKGGVFNTLFSFSYGNEITPIARVIFGRDGLLYGTTSGDYGTFPGDVFNLRPPPRACTSALCPWTRDVVFTFSYGVLGYAPTYGDIFFDGARNIYGTLDEGGNSNQGVVYELPYSNGNYSTETPLWTFSGPDGATPLAGVILDSSGNVYGTTYQGGLHTYGTVYELMPGVPYTETLAHSFTDGSDGAYPWAGVTSDVYDPTSGNLFGAASDAGKNGGGTVFELIPMNGSYAF